MADKNMTFREAYGVLQRHAETLRNQSDPNIDDLLPMVEESVAAYRVCKERIDAVETALEKALTNVAAEAAPRAATADGAVRPASDARTQGAAATGRAPAPAVKSGFEDMDDDIPF